MGRNSGSQIFWTQVQEGAGHITTYYCQQHAVWEQGTDNNILKNHTTTVHGNVDQ